MSSSQLESRLETAQAEIASALSDGRLDAMPELVASREDDMRELTVRLEGDSELRRWAADYLERDRRLVVAAQAAQAQVVGKLLEVQRNKSIHRRYLSEGLRR